jgi:hypothetical protein
MGGSIGVPDVSQLPIQSDVSNLRNANAAFSPQPLPPAPGGIGQGVVPGSTEDLEQRSLQTFLNPPQFQQPDVSQFQQPDLGDPLEQAKQVIVSHLQASQQANASRGSRIKNILTDFFHGAGNAMMVHAGVPTPEMQRQRDVTNLLEISNAQSNQGLRQAHEGLYRLQSQMADRQMPDGRWIQVPIAHVGAFDAAMARIQAAPDKAVNPQQATFEYLTRPIAQGGKGLTADAAYQLIQKQPADIAPDRETFNYLTRPREQGGLGLNPSQAYDKMHPRQNLTMGSTDVKDIADAIESGDQPPTLTGLYRNAAPVRAELARRGVPIAKMEMDWNATKRYMATLNGPQQVRLRQAIETAGDSLDKIQGLYDEWQKLAPVSGFKLANHGALVAMKNLPGRAGAVANSLDAQIADLTSELGNVYMGGNSPTDHSLKLAQQNLSSDWGPDAFQEAMKQARLNIGIRKNSITHGAPAVVSGDNTYMPAAPPQAAPATDPFAQFGGKSR